MKNKPNALIISSLVVGMLLTILAQFGFREDAQDIATIIGAIGIVLIVLAIVLMYLPTRNGSK